MRKSLLLFLIFFIVGKFTDVNAQTCNAGTITANPDTVCANTIAHLTVTGSSGSLQWQSADSSMVFTNIAGATSATYNTNPLSVNTYYRVIASGMGCSDTSATQVITVVLSPSVTFTYNVIGDSVIFYANVSGGVLNYFWDFGDGSSSTAANPSHTFSSPSTYDVCVTVKNSSNCNYTECENITTTLGGGPCNAGIISAFLDSICQGSLAELSVTGSSGTLQWQSADSAGVFTAIAGDSSSSYTSNLLSVNTYYRVIATGTGCSDTSGVQLITVVPYPTVTFSDTVIQDTVMFFPNVGGGLVTYSWDFGDGTSNSAVTNPVHVFLTAGTYDVCLNVENSGNCSNVACKNVTTTTNAPCSAGTVTAYPNPVCASSQVNLTVTGSSGQLQWQIALGSMNFSDIADANNVGYQMPAEANTYFRVVATGTGCSDTSAPVAITVLPAPSVSVSDTVIQDTAMFFSNQSVNVTEYTWSFGDGSALSNEANPVHIFNASGAYNVCLTVADSDNCNYTTCTNVTIGSSGPCAAGTITISDTVICGGSFVELNSYGSSGNLQWQAASPLTYYNWENISGANGPYWIDTPTDTTLYRLMATGTGCADSSSPVMVVVNPSVVVLFTSSVSGDTVTVSAPFYPGLQYIWSFGDGTIDTTATTPLSHSYSAAGIYNVCLSTFYPGSGCGNTTCQEVATAGYPDPCGVSFFIYPDSIPHVWFIDFQAQGVQPITYTWYWGDGSSSTGEFVSHTYYSAGFYTICLKVEDATGCVSEFCDSSFNLFRSANGGGIIQASVVQGTATGIAQAPAPANNMQVVPNPCSTCEVRGINNANDIFVTDILGRRITATYYRTAQGFIINMPDSPTGIYFVKNLQTGEVVKVVLVK